MSANVGDAMLVFCLGSSLRLERGEGENGCILPFTESRQQHGLAIGELERVMIDVKRALVDLAKDLSSPLWCGRQTDPDSSFGWSSIA
jgi:hypothetical protein